MNKMSRIEEALRLRDKALQLARTHGTYKEIPGCFAPALSLEIGRFSISCNSPFNPFSAPLSVHDTEERRKNGLPDIKPHLLDLWVDRKKALSVQWGEDYVDDTVLVSFKRGDWEKELMQTSP